MRLFNVILVRSVLFLIRKISLKPQQQLSSLHKFARKRVQVAGLKHLPSKFPFIIATNHRFSTWSLTLLVAYFYSELNRKIYVITKEEICKLLGEKATKWLGLIPDNQYALKRSLSLLKQGEIIALVVTGEKDKLDKNGLLID